MKALVYIGPGSMELAERPRPEPREGEALVRVEAVGICGSDMHAFLGHDERRPPPLILGHEAAGTVVEGAEPGQRVTVNPLVSCGRCEACLSGRDNICGERQIISLPPREGAFAEYLAMPERNLVPIPPDYPAAKAALAEPLACGWHAVRLAARGAERPLAASAALVVGGGAIGLAAALSLRAFGAGRVTIAEPNALRHPALQAAGFAVLDPAEVSPAAQHVVIDAYGGESSRTLACAAVAPGGVIVHVGLASGAGGLDARRMTLQEIAVLGAYTYTAADFRQTVAAMLEGRLGPLDWPEVRPLAEGARAFAELKAGTVGAPKITLTP